VIPSTNKYSRNST